MVLRDCGWFDGGSGVGDVTVSGTLILGGVLLPWLAVGVDCSLGTVGTLMLVGLLACVDGSHNGGSSAILG